MGRSMLVAWRWAGPHVARIAVGLAVILCGGAAHVDAACNAIPSPDGMRANVATPTGSAPSGAGASAAAFLREASFGGAFPFKGALGRTNRAIVFPGATARIAVAADSVCVGGGKSLRRHRVAGPDDVVAAIVYSGTDADGQPAVVARVFARGKLCQDLTAAGAAPVARSGRDGRAEVSLLPDCTNKGVRFRSLTVKSGRPAYALELPVEPVDAPALHDVSPDVRIAIFRAADAGEVHTRLATLAGEGARCEALCPGAGIGASLEACIDGFYLTVPPQGPGQAASYGIDEVACNVAIVQGLTCESNDFRSLCDSPTVTGLASCTGTTEEIAFYRSNCGGIHFPFSWKNIRTDETLCPAPNPGCIDRIVSGRSGLARLQKGAGTGEGVYLPGREFVGASYCDATCQSPPCVGGDWRVPEIDLTDLVLPAAGRADIGLTGVVDKDDSVVHVFPAVRANFECEEPGQPAEACTAVAHYQGKNQEVCACRDRYPAGCACKGPVAAPQFFECEPPPGWSAAQAYPYTGMPCTRPNHCPGGGYCRGRRKCVPKEHAAWGAQTPAPAGSSCTTDNDCPGNQVCGHRLFDVADRIDASTGRGVLYGSLDGLGAKRDRRGVCRGDPKTRCNKASECGTNPPCRGFEASAGDKP